MLCLKSWYIYTAFKFLRAECWWQSTSFHCLIPKCHGLKLQIMQTNFSSMSNVQLKKNLIESAGDWCGLDRVWALRLIGYQWKISKLVNLHHSLMSHPTSFRPPQISLNSVAVSLMHRVNTLCRISYDLQGIYWPPYTGKQERLGSGRKFTSR